MTLDLNMADLGRDAVLAGATNGRTVLAEMLKVTAKEPSAITPVLLNSGWLRSPQRVSSAKACWRSGTPSAGAGQTSTL